MELLLQTPVIWFIIGFILLILEFVLPGLILFFFGVGAWFVAILSLFIDMSLNTQLIVFVITSVITILLLRKWVGKMLYGKKQPSELLEDEFLGKTARSETSISPGEDGKVFFKGTSWQASSEDWIGPGENVIITDTDSIILIVKSTKNIS